jgi:hypothetical protein
VSVAAVVVLYLYLALRRVYGDGRTAALLKGVFLMAATAFVLVLYRYFLFFKTMHSIHAL